MPQVTSGTLARLSERVKAALQTDHGGEGELIAHASKARLCSMIGALGRGEQNALGALLIEAGLAPVLASLPPDAALMLRCILSSGYPRGAGSHWYCSPSDAAVMVPGVPIYSPLAWQRELHLCRARYRTVACGRRAGKTEGGAGELRDHLLCNPSALAWSIHPTFAMGEKVFGQLVRSLPAPIIRRAK